MMFYTAYIGSQSVCTLYAWNTFVYSQSFFIWLLSYTYYWFVYITI